VAMDVVSLENLLEIHADDIVRIRQARHQVRDVCK